MATYADLITDALIELNVHQPGEPIEPADSALGLSRLNMMRDVWNTEKLLILEVQQETFTLVVDQRVYTIGPAAEFPTSRPVKIEDAVLIDTSVTPNVRYGMRVLDKDEFIAMPFYGTAAFPAALYFEPSYPVAYVHLSDAPETALDLELSVWQPWTTSLTLTTTVSLPPAYYECVLYNLALRLANAFGVEPTALLVQFARESRAKVKSLNSKSPKLRSDVPQGLSR
ncbi:MAG: hypothetical protein PHC88_05575 [Terrimicrobiaceae bacterium]|nr:hypothetical protein [Terrimicrobiaceae bacterium]